MLTRPASGPGGGAASLAASRSTSVASSAVSAVTLTSASPPRQRETRIVQPGPLPSSASRHWSRAARATTAPGGSRTVRPRPPQPDCVRVRLRARCERRKRQRVDHVRWRVGVIDVDHARYKLHRVEGHKTMVAGTGAPCTPIFCVLGDHDGSRTGSAGKPPPGDAAWSSPANQAPAHPTRLSTLSLARSAQVAVQELDDPVDGALLDVVHLGRAAGPASGKM